MLSCTTRPPREITAISVVPPPMSTTMLPWGASMSRPIPRAAAMGSKIRYTSRPPACSVESRTALISTSVEPEGMPTTTLRLGVNRLRLRLLACLMNPRIIISAALKSAMTPSRRGLTVFSPGFTFSCISLACWPSAMHFPLLLLIAMMLGSSSTISSFWYMTVLAVPRSIASSWFKNENAIFQLMKVSLQI